MSEPEIGDGLAAFADAVDPVAMAEMLNKLVRWPDPEAVARLPVWFPELARKMPLYKAGWMERATNKKRPKTEGNTSANTALTRTLNQSSKARPHWTCCHIWGNDDTSYASGHSEVNDPRYYSSPANMVLVPTPLKAITDFVPQFKIALRLTAYRLYGFLPDARTLPDRADAGDWMPIEWTEPAGPAVVRFGKVAETAMKRRVAQISDDLKLVGTAYPAGQVRETIGYWCARKPESLLDTIGGDV